MPANNMFGRNKDLIGVRKYGQVWTPQPIAEIMAEYVLADQSSTVFDPAVGEGVFFRVAKKIAERDRFKINLVGMEIDELALKKAIASGLDSQDLHDVSIGDFILSPPQTKFSAIIANPPYVRHHRIDKDKKKEIRRQSERIIGKPIDGRAGLHVHFLIRSLTLLAEDGRLSFIVPSDICEGRFAEVLWQWIASNFAIEAVLTFDAASSPFPHTDINPIILFIRHSPPKNDFIWARCKTVRYDILKRWVLSGFSESDSSELYSVRRKTEEGIKTGLSRFPHLSRGGSTYYVLADFAQVRRGIATGANDFFFMTLDRMYSLGLSQEYFVRSIGRTRDVPGEEIDEELLSTLEEQGRPTWLLSLGDICMDQLPAALVNYLNEGELKGLPNRPLIAQRKPWYKMERRDPPPILFAYLGRRRCRFIKNNAGIVPLSCFLCLYPFVRDDELIERLCSALNHPDTLANLSLVGKSYGGGAIKVEPRLLERLPIPDHVVDKFDLRVCKPSILNNDICGYINTYQT
ncbi:MAG: N-6 DNA methylase [Methylacidiphilales bacterium]|nr:N-6 DNA methylase [Candidatus Methylacidiphilales bacterium]